jgi:translation initiation factor IF-3
MTFTHCKISDLGKFRLDREEKQSKDKKKRFVAADHITSLPAG